MSRNSSKGVITDKILIDLAYKSQGVWGFGVYGRTYLFRNINVKVMFRLEPPRNICDGELREVPLSRVKDIN